MLDVIVEKITVKRTGIMYQGISQISKNLQAIGEWLRDDMLSCHNTQKFIVGFRAAQAKRCHQDTANLKTGLNCYLQVSLSQAIKAVVCCKLFTLCLAQVL